MLNPQKCSFQALDQSLNKNHFKHFVSAVLLIGFLNLPSQARSGSPAVSPELSQLSQGMDSGASSFFKTNQGHRIAQMPPGYGQPMMGPGMPNMGGGGMPMGMPGAMQGGMMPGGMPPQMMGGMPPMGMDPRMMAPPMMGPDMMGGMPGAMGGGMPFGNFAGLDPNDPVQQALSLHQAGRYADAIQIYESIIINNPPDPRIYASLSDAHFRLGNSSRALKYSVEALKLDPNYSSGHLLIGTILGDMGDFVRAIRSYERVISLDQNNPYAYYNLGLIYYKKADIRTALEYFERARDLNPNDPKIWNNLGVAYYDSENFPKASAAFSQALALDPQYEAARRNMELVRGKVPSPSYASAKRKTVRKKAAYGKRSGTRKKVVRKK
jgi:Flp pilus assembly protein TadD